MRDMTRLLITIVFLHVTSAVLVAGQSETAAAAFAKRLAQALAGGDRAAIGEMIRYPMPATVGGIVIPIGTRTDLLNFYDGVFTPELRCLVEESAAKGATAVRTDARGMTFANGSIHIHDVGGTLKMTRVDVPASSGLAPPPASKPQRMTRRNQQFSGRLYSGGVDAYVFSGRKGDVVQARIEQFTGRSAAVRVVQVSSGKVLQGPSAPAPRVWNGTIQEPGEYRVEVVRLAPYCLPSFTYLLTITIK
jgi:hypothetical protein